MAAIAFIIGFGVFAPASYAAVPELSCDAPIQEITLYYGDQWDSQFDSGSHSGAVYGFSATGYGDYCTWTASVNNYHDTLSFDDEGGSESVVLYQTEVPEDVLLENGCSEPLTVDYCPLY